MAISFQGGLTEIDGGNGVQSLNGLIGPVTLSGGGNIVLTPVGNDIEISATGFGVGSVTSVSVVTANGFSGTVANSTTTPAITIDASALDAAKIADGSVTNAEFQYLGGVTSDIQTQLDGKVDENAAITGATKTKVTYDAKGLVTAGADATTADIADSSNRRYVTDAQLVVIGNTSGTNTGDQTSVSGNAGTATALQTARNINGVAFDGTADITVTAAAGTLTGATLASGVTASSLTSVGALTALTMGGTLAMGANNITSTGSLGSTGSRLTKGWFVDLQVTNAIVGGVTGNAGTATALQNARTIGGVSFDGTSNIVPATITVADTTDSTCSVALFESATGDLAPKTDGGITYNASTGILTATGFAGPLTGDVTGNVSGSSGSTTGNAATATALQNARTIGGVSFNGTANITVSTATGGFTVSGGDLALGANNITMTGSLGATGARLTKGWFTDLQVTNAIAGSVTGNAATATALQNARTIGGTSFDGTANITVATATGGFTVSGGDLAIGANNITGSGSLGSTGTRFTKGWFTDLQVTNAIAGSITGSAPTLTTARAIYGNNFDGSAAITAIIASTYGGTGNGFTKFSGPATTEKTFTLPNASATILTDNALVTSAQGGTGNGFTKFTGPASTEKTFTLPNATATILTSNDVVTGAQGGTGVNNSGKTIQIGGNFATSGAFDCILTVTAGTNVTLPTSGTLATTTSPASYNPTFTGFGTPTNVTAYQMQKDGVGYVWITFTSGITTATEARISLPFTSSSSKIPTLQFAGDTGYSAAAAIQYIMLIESNVAYLTMGAQSSTLAGLVKRNGNALIASGQLISLYATVLL